MFTTTLTRVNVQPIIHPLPFGPGDVVHWPAAGDIYCCYHTVDSVFMGNSGPCARMWEVGEKNTDPDKNGHHWTNPVDQFKDVRVVKSNRDGWRQGAPYLFVERGEQTEEVTFEHEFAVGDVVKAEQGIYDWRIAEIGFDKQGEAGYRLVATDDGYDAGFYPFEHCDGGEYRLVGGPRFVEKVTALQTLVKARDLIADPEHWIKGDYERLGQRFCSVGAIWHVVKDSDDRVRAQEALAAVIDPTNEDSHHVIVRFNDDKATHAQVLAAFDAAIANARFVELNG